MRRSLLLGMALMLVGAAAVAWVYRDQLKGRYYAYRLIHASESDVGMWAEQCGEWGDAVPEKLLDCLLNDDEAACLRAGIALNHAVERGSLPNLSTLLSERFHQFSELGQQVALDCATAMASRNDPQCVQDCRLMVRSGLQSNRSEVRMRAAALAMKPAIGQSDLLAPFLRDPSPQVRRAAILAVGSTRALVEDDDLLPGLHDADPECRRLTETALRSRGLRAIDVRLGKLLTDPRPAKRLELLTLLRDDGELDLSTWLRRLFDDPTPAVRSAAARLAADLQVFQLTDRLVQMSTSDPDLTVRQTIQFHLRQFAAPIRPVGATSP